MFRCSFVISRRSFTPSSGWFYRACPTTGLQPFTNHLLFVSPCALRKLVPTLSRSFTPPHKFPVRFLLCKRVIPLLFESRFDPLLSPCRLIFSIFACTCCSPVQTSVDILDLPGPQVGFSGKFAGAPLSAQAERVCLERTRRPPRPAAND